MVAGHDENVSRRLGIDVPKSDSSLSAFDDVGRDVAGHDPTEQAVAAHGGVDRFRKK